MIRQTVAVVLLAVAVPAWAQSTADPTAGILAAKPQPEKQVCRRIEETGSIMGGKRACHTKAEWASIDQRNDDRVSASRDQNGQGGNRQGGGFN